MKTQDYRLQRGLRAYLVVTVSFTGAIVMLVEILAVRIIAPYFGSSIFVWTAVISVTLLSLALGYFLGGKAADRTRPDLALYWCILLSGAYLFLSFIIRRPVLEMASGFGLRLGALFSSACLFCLPLCLLGAVSPLAVKAYARRLETIGSGVGLLYFFSTAGSFLGTLFTGFLLLPYLGVSVLLSVAAGVLVALSAAYFFLFLKRPAYLALLVLLFLGLYPFGQKGLKSAYVNGTIWRELYKADSFYTRLKVLEAGGIARFLIADGTNQGGLDIREGFSWVPYAYVVDVLSRMAAPKMKRALVIGLGPGVVPNLFSRRGVDVDAVEIDPAVIAVYRKYFSDYGDRQRIGIFSEDGRCFIKRASGSYDLVLLDVFVGDSSPWHLLTREAFSEIRRVLVPTGALVINFVGSVQDARGQAVIRAIHRTLREVFDYACVFNSRARIDTAGAQNVFFLASDQDVPEEFSGVIIVPEALRQAVELALGDRIVPDRAGTFVLSDDYDPLDFYTARAKESWRRAILQAPEKEMLLD